MPTQPSPHHEKWEGDENVEKRAVVIDSSVLYVMCLMCCFL
jgi:hypothetical protein